jgi:hypothetical protein
LIAERRTIIIALAIGLTTLLATMAINYRSPVKPHPSKPPPSATSHAIAGANH